MTDDSPGSFPPPSPKIDTTVPHSARIWNYWLGGKDYYPVDKEAADQYAKLFPDNPEIALASRHFLMRTIQFLAGECGIRQFLDIGTGLPTVDNTHEVAQRVAPESRIVYVDNDPLVLAHARALLTSTPQGMCDYIDADLRDPDRILSHAVRALDFSQPIGLILSGILGHIPDIGEARSILARLLAALAPGSYLSLNDGTNVVAGQALADAQQAYNESGAAPYVQRTPEEIASFFDGLEVVDPGIVSCPRWRPEATPFGLPAEVDAWGGVGKKP